MDQPQDGAAQPAPLDPAAPCNRAVHERLIAMEAAERGRQELMPGLLEVIQQQRQQHDGRRRVKTPTYDGKSDIRQFLALFNHVAEVNRWEGDETCLQLKLALSGTTRQCLQGDTYEELTQSLLNRYEISEDEALRELRGLKWRSGEDLHQFADYAKRLVERANPGLREDQTQAMAIREIVEATGDKQLRREFRLRPVEDYSEALAWIHDYLNDMGKDRRSHMRRVCASSGLEDSDPSPELTKVKDEIERLDVKVSTLESKFSSELKEVKTDLKSGQQDMKDMLTTILHGSPGAPPRNQGHPPKSNFRPDNRFCQYCKIPGHVIGDCRKLKWHNRQEAEQRAKQAENNRGPSA